MWIFLWHYELFVATLGAMMVLLATLIAVYQRLGVGQTKVTSGETWAVRVPFSIYLGWITVASVANFSDVLEFLNWNQFGISAAAWMVIILAAVLIIAGLMNFRRRDVAYTAVILWGLAGIAVKFPQEGIVTIATWITFCLVGTSLIAAFLFKREPV
jgi:benzodiazapine receptor